MRLIITQFTENGIEGSSASTHNMLKFKKRFIGVIVSIAIS